MQGKTKDEHIRSLHQIGEYFLLVAPFFIYQEGTIEKGVQNPVRVVTRTNYYYSVSYTGPKGKKFHGCDIMQMRSDVPSGINGNAIIVKDCNS